MKPKLNLDRYFIFGLILIMIVLSGYTFLLFCKLLPSFINFIFGIAASH